jgi:dTDP-4-amino-4,6-dideoxygalactose transaminase
MLISKKNRARTHENIIQLGISLMATSETSMNLVLEELEKEIAGYIGTRFAILCSSGRMAIWLSLLALGIGHGDEVVIPDFACQILPITVFCVGAVPKFCDIDRKTLALSPSHLLKILGKSTKAVIFAPLFGMPADPSHVLEIADKNGIVFIDDAAQAIGTEIRGRKAGSFGRVGILTFYKSLDVDLGAAVTTNDEKLAARIRLLWEKYESKSVFATIGYKMIGLSRLRSRRIMKTVFRGDKYLRKLVKMTFTRKHYEIVNGWVEADPYVFESWQSKVLTNEVIDQLMSYGKTYSYNRELQKTEILYLKEEFENLENYLEDRRKIARMYDELIVDNDLRRVIVPPNSVASYLRYPIFFSERNRLSKCIKRLTLAGFHLDYRYEPLHGSPFFSSMNRHSDFKESIFVSKHVLPLPVSNLNRDHRKAEEVISTVNLSSSK